MTDPTHCPKCGASFDAGPIPADLREHYSPPYRWSRLVGIEENDRLVAWECPDCKHRWRIMKR